MADVRSFGEDCTCPPRHQEAMKVAGFSGHAATIPCSEEEAEMGEGYGFHNCPDCHGQGLMYPTSRAGAPPQPCWRCLMRYLRAIWQEIPTSSDIDAMSRDD